MTLFLSKIKISDNPSIQSLGALLSPSETSTRMTAHHRLLWAAFTDGPERKRDFLWRDEGKGVFFTLSKRPPVQTDIFGPHQIKTFAPDLSAGTLLNFKLRANATRAKRGGARVDVVMDALHEVPKLERSDARMPLAQREGKAWLTRQGEKAAFNLVEVTVENYTAQVLEGNNGALKRQPKFGVLEMTGRLEVNEPEAFLSHLSQGFGRAKAFGCGLMLIRRA